MSAEPNDKKHLTPRQIINRYRKGEYVDESIEAISSAISSCGEVFDSVAIAFPTTLVQKIVENLSTAQTLYERQKEGKPIDDIVIEDYPYLKGVTDPYEADLSGKNPYSSWTVSYSEEELVQRLLSKGYAAGSGIDSLELTYSELGNVIQVKVFYENGQSNTLKPEKIRSAFGVPSIRFTVNGKETGSGSQSGSGGLSVSGGGALDPGKNYFVISGGGTVSQVSGEKLYSISGSGTIRPVEEAGEDGSPDVPSGAQVTVSGGSFTFRGSGNGHQLGLSQYGAWAMAERGFSYDEIIEFYYPGAVVR